MSCRHNELGPLRSGLCLCHHREGTWGVLRRGLGSPWVFSALRGGRKGLGRGNFSRGERERGGMVEPPRCGSSLAFLAGWERRNDSHGGWLKTPRDPPKVLLLLGCSRGENPSPRPWSSCGTTGTKGQGWEVPSFFFFFMAFFNPRTFTGGMNQGRLLWLVPCLVFLRVGWRGWRCG